MQAVLLLAGQSSRFYPINTFGHKSMCFIYGKPLVYYAIEDLKHAGIKKFVIVTAPNDNSVQNYFGNGESFGIEIKYTVQTNPEGQIEAIRAAKDLITEDFILSANSLHFGEFETLKLMLEKFREVGVDAVLGGAYCDNPWHYSAYELDGDRILSLTEKPEKGKQKSNIKKTFLEAYKLEFLDRLLDEPPHPWASIFALNKYLKGHNVRLVMTPKGQFSASFKFAWDLFKIKNRIAELVNINKEYPDTRLVVEGNTKIADTAKVTGSCYLGSKVKLNEGVLVGDSDLEEDVVVGENSKIKDSIVMRGSRIGANCVISDSIIGPENRIGDNVIVKSINADGTNISVEIKGQSEDTKLKTLGLISGKGVSIQSGAKIGAGTLLAANSTYK